MSADILDLKIPQQINTFYRKDIASLALLSLQVREEELIYRGGIWEYTFKLMEDWCFCFIRQFA